MSSLCVDVLLLQSALPSTSSHAAFSQTADVKFVKPLALRVEETGASDAVFIVQPTLLATRMVAGAIKQLQASPGAARGAPPGFHLLFLPRRSFVADQVLEEEGVLQDCDTVETCEVDLLPVDEDLLSMECPAGFGQVFLHGDNSLVAGTARALLRLQLLYGMARRVHAKGTLSCACAESLLQHKNDVLHSGSADGIAFNPSAQLHSIVLLDRSVDLVSPLVSPLSFEALLHEALGLHAGVVSVPPEEVAKDPNAPEDAPRAKGELARVALNSSDDVYVDVRDMHISVVPGHLKKQARDLQDWYEGRLDLSRTDEIATYVKNITGQQKNVRATAQMINLVTLVQKHSSSDAFTARWQMERSMLDTDNERGVLAYLLELMAQQEDVTTVLRLLCLHSQCMGGLGRSDMDLLRQSVLDAYGFEHILTLEHLERCGLLRSGGQGVLSFAGLGGGGKAWPWSSLRNDLGLVAQAVDVQHPSSPHYLTSGYAPLSSHIAHLAAKDAWGGQAAMKSVEGPSLSLLQLPGQQTTQAAQDAYVRATTSTSAGASSAADTDVRRTVIVAFVGGVSYLEVAALRFISEHGKRHCCCFITTPLHPLYFRRAV